MDSCMLPYHETVPFYFKSKCRILNPKIIISKYIPNAIYVKYQKKITATESLDISFLFSNMLYKSTKIDHWLVDSMNRC